MLNPLWKTHARMRERGETNRKKEEKERRKKKHSIPFHLTVGHSLLSATNFIAQILVEFSDFFHRNVTRPRQCSMKLISCVLFHRRMSLQRPSTYCLIWVSLNHWENILELIIPLLSRRRDDNPHKASSSAGSRCGCSWLRCCYCWVVVLFIHFRI